MENKNFSNKKIDDLFKAKEEFHKKLARLPFEEKIRILVKLQKIANNIKSSSRKKHNVWKISL